ncbi:MAG: GxxExxY protein [Chitinophagaceae bacterium]
MQNFVNDLLFKDECYNIIGLCMKVHSKLGKGFKEIVYKDVLEIELKKQAISFEREKPLQILYDGFTLPHSFVADFVVYDSIILELKASFQIHPDNFRQTLNYLKATQIKLGLLINFGEKRLNFQRIVCSY